MFTPIIEPTVNVQEGLSSRNNGNFAFNFAYLQFYHDYAQLFFCFSDHYKIIAIISISTSVGVVLIVIIVSSLVVAAVCIISRKTCNEGKGIN